ncbi:MAG TPA: hypothetical protein DCP31_21645 [Cyanobacteria bacterium UBA8543]|nr:hypothetical protein [Cyanobacteria bacterium UBA8543]
MLFFVVGYLLLVICYQESYLKLVSITVRQKNALKQTTTLRHFGKAPLRQAQLPLHFDKLSYRAGKLRASQQTTNNKQQMVLKTQARLGQVCSSFPVGDTS